MPVPQVKICGICRSEDAEGVAALLPDAMGFVFHPSSPRAVTAPQVAEWTRALPAGIVKVGVFVNVPPAEVAAILEQAGLDVAQLHGRETPADCRAVGGAVWKALHLERPLPDPLIGYPVDAFLIDGYSSASPGGTGTQADWDAAAHFAQRAPGPVWLAGGLRPNNVAEAIRRVRPHGLDVSSGVEQRPGQKDLHQVKDFIAQCRSV